MNAIAGPESAAATLRGRWLAIARIAWVALVVLMLGLFIAAVHAGYLRFSRPPEVVRESLSQLGLSISSYAAYLTALLVIFSLGCFAVAAMIFWRKSDDAMGLFVSFMLVLLGAVNVPNADALEELYPTLIFPVEFSLFLLLASLVLFLFLFPDGRFVPRWTRTLVLVWIAAFSITLFLTRSSLASDPPDAVMVIILGAALPGVVAQIYRYMRVSNAVQRQQTKWVVLGTAVALTGQTVYLLLPPLFPPALSPPGLHATPYDLAGVTIVSLSYFLIPLSIGVAILRYRLWDIDLLINRALVYGALTACIISIYVLAVGYLGALFQARGGLAVSLIATGVVAVLFAPLRDRLQRGVNRLMYGERDEPYAVLSRLGRHLEGTLAPEAVLPAIVESVARALRLGHAAIWLAGGGALRLEAAYGAPPAETTVQDAGVLEQLRHAPDGLRPEELGPSSEYGAVLEGSGVALVLPLTHRGELVGALGLTPRGPGEGFSPADRRLLRDLANQVGTAAHAIRLTVALRTSLEELRRSRERLVAAQEEERRRIQRDLHDGLGPVLASMRLRLEACLDAAQDAEDPLGGDLERLYELVGQATGDIRRLVYDLRPPVLDQLGLVPALQQHCECFSRETGVEVSFEAESDLPVPAAAEVVILRVAQEALLNVGKHACASRADVRLQRSDGWLTLEVRDDGVGFEAESRDGGEGTGVGSMRERAELLGGTLRLAGNPDGGSEVVARIPVGSPAGEARR